MTPSEVRALIDIAVRPEADVFRMLDGDAFDDLCDGIKSNGLLEPIELDSDGAIGDGRNRYAACRRLGIEPTTVTLPAETDWLARVVERNLNRRHSPEGARAVSLVKAGASRGRTNRALGRMAGLSEATIRRARFLVEHGYTDLVEQVEAGGSLRAAYDLAVDCERRRADVEQEELDEEARRVARLEELEAERAELVAAVRTSLDAIGAPATIPPEPELAVTLKTPEDVERAVSPPPVLDTAALRAQERFHIRIRKLREDLEAIRDVPIDADGPMFEGLVMAMRVWTTQIVALVYDTVERYNTALDRRASLRRVK